MDNVFVCILPWEL